VSGSLRRLGSLVGRRTLFSFMVPQAPDGVGCGGRVIMDQKSAWPRPRCGALDAEAFANTRSKPVKGVPVNVPSPSL
jgi:hypothetical protein